MAELFVQFAPTYLAERRYITDLLLGEILGLDFEIQPVPRSEYCIGAVDGKELTISDVLFRMTKSDWLTTKVLPKQPLKSWNLNETGAKPRITSTTIPIIYGENPTNPNFFDVGNDRIQLGLDVFGSAFFMLTRLEEIIKNERDDHDRFPAKASLAFQAGFLDRPIINEYVEILWWCLRQLWPNLQRKKRVFSVALTHDIDRPLRYRTPMQVLKTASSKLLLEYDLRGSVSWLKGGLRRVTDVQTDPFYEGVLKLMDISEKNRLRSTFNFMSAVKSKKDFGYAPSSPVIQHLLQSVQQRRHEIGFHPGYTTMTDPDAFLWQKRRLEEACQQTIVGGRQHFLRFKVPDTWRAWEASGATYDSTLGYAARAGFRCGFCYPYSVFDVLEKRLMNVKERPLIVMDGQLKADFNEGLTPNLAYERTIQLAKACQQVEGEFVLLWHNSSLSNEWGDWGCLYERLVAELADMQRQNEIG